MIDNTDPHGSEGPTVAQHPDEPTRPGVDPTGPLPPAPVTGEPVVDDALASFVEALPGGLAAHVEAGAALDVVLRSQLQGLAGTSD